MINLFKKYFIPHQHNDHQPHILRWEAALVILSLVLIVEVYFLIQAFWFVPWTNFFASVMPETVVGLTNEQRAANDLISFQVNPILAKAAQLKVDDMAGKGYFAHVSPEGVTPWHWLEKAGYKYNAAGENLAINFIDSQDLTDAWMNSPTHRANILNNNFTEIGIATAQGLYQGKETVFVAQFFGRPLTVLSPSKEINTHPSPSAQASILPAAQLAVAPTTDQAPFATPATEILTAVQGTASEETIVLSEAPPPQEMAIKQNAAPPNFLNRILTTPHAISNYFYFVLLTILALALLLKVFVKIKIQHPALIVNGVALIIIISAILLANQYIALAQAKIL